MTTTRPGDETSDRMPPSPPGWYADPSNGRLRWWDGYRWIDSVPGVPQAPMVAPQGYLRPAPPDEKSVAVASVLTVLWPGLGHVYLGENQKAVPHLIVNGIGFVIAWTIILLPITVVAWAITLAITLPGISRDTAKTNAEALVEYQRRWGLG